MYYICEFRAEDDKLSRRDRYSGPTVEFREKDSYKPNIKLDYIDDDGHLLCEKEAFRFVKILISKMSRNVCKY